MGPRLILALAQVNLLVGDVQGNLARTLREANRARDELGADLVLFPELTLSGYPPEDLLFHRGMRTQIERALQGLAAARGIGLVLGFPEYEGTQIHNSAAVYRDGERLALTRKACLPNYRVFDEKRYFMAGAGASVFECQGLQAGTAGVRGRMGARARAARARRGRRAVARDQRLAVRDPSPARARAGGARARRECGLPVVYLNLYGGQDELVFDGNSFVMARDGALAMRAPAFEEGLYRVEFERRDGAAVPVAAAVEPELGAEASVYRALVLGVRDYVNKHGFPGVVMGLSGGVDSALTLAIAVDALGAERVQAVMMPSRYTSQMSIEDATAQARGLGVKISSIPIEGLFEAALSALEREFAGRDPDTTEENIQARVRGLLLMAISNKTGRMLLTTGNKSEMAVGYATLYGDMNGGFAPIKDCSKMLVYRLAEYRNSLAPPAVPGHSGARDRARAERRAAPRAEGHRLAPSLRHPRSRSSRHSSRKTCRSMKSARAVSSAPS